YFREQAAGAENGRPESIARQNRRFLDFCEASGFEVATTFAEEGRGARGTAFAQMVEFLKRPEKGFVVVVSPSPATLADDAVLAAARCLQLERLGAQVLFMDRSYSNGDALQAVLNTWATSRGEELREKVKDALKRKAVRGEVLGRPPYGYKVGARNRLEVVQEEAVVVRYIFKLYLEEGLGIRLIARRLNEEGLRTRRNRPWSMVSIRDILRNRVYLGTYQRLGVRVPGTHPALISPDDFRRAQERLSDRRTNFSPRTVRRFLLSGLLVCGTCGNRMIGVSRRQSWTRRTDGTEQVASYRYYQCESRTNQGTCSYNTQRAEDLEEAVRQQLSEIDPKMLATAGNDEAVIQHWQAECRRLRERLHQVDKRLGRELEAAARDPARRERLRSHGLELAEERLRLEEELRDAEWRAEHYASVSERRRTRDAALKLLVGDWEALPFEDKQSLLRELIDTIRVSEDGARITFRP
ncbi:MAG TPA: recombinase family protein, partial [Dehalococcoidia bacterium]|nr:recombinase family protein [Dehalococcoidia bacterium]